MRVMRPRIAILALVSALLVATPAGAVTPDELAELAKAGLGDEVLVALIETTGVSVPVDAEAAIALKRAGVSERVIAAAVRASKPPELPMPFEPPVDCVGCFDNPTPPVTEAMGTPAPVVLEREVYREVYVYVPVAVAPYGRPARPRAPEPYFTGDRGFGRFINDGVSLPRDPKATPRR